MCDIPARVTVDWDLEVCCVISNIYKEQMASECLGLVAHQEKKEELHASSSFLFWHVVVVVNDGHEVSTRPVVQTPLIILSPSVLWMTSTPNVVDGNDA